MPRKNEYRRRSKEYNEYQKKWAKAHVAQIRSRARTKHRDTRKIAIELYGGKCFCCGQTEYEFLAIDHIAGGGTRERREKFPNSQSFYNYVSKTHLPDKYRIACHNCNSALGFYGHCPHDRDDNIVRCVAAYDMHYPKIHQATFNLMLKFIQQNNIRLFVFGGDQFDNECISHHTKGKPLYRPRMQYLKDERGFETNVLRPLEQSLSSDCRKILILGNHERFEYDLHETNPEMEGYIEHVKSLRLVERGWEIIPLGNTFRYGKLNFIHGEWLTGIGNQGGVFPARKAVEVFAGNVLAGHTHSPQSFTRVSPVNQTQKWMGWIAPILGKANPLYMRNRPNSWVNGFVTIEFNKNGNFNLYPVIVTGDSFQYGGKEYRV